MKEYTVKEEPVFSDSILVTEATDPAHADNVNAGPKQLLENTLALKKEMSVSLSGLKFAVNDSGILTVTYDDGKGDA